MTTTLSSHHTQPPHELRSSLPQSSSSQTIDLALFPDGLKTTGQHEPLPEHLRPFEDFPAEITGRTVWKAEDYKDRPEKWVHRFTAAEVEELSTAADRFIAAGTPLTGITQVTYISQSRFDQWQSKLMTLEKLHPP